jgi:hypothetical protein
LEGWPAALTTTGTARTDILAQVGEDHLPVAIQVKTKSPSSRDFQLKSVDDPAAPQANEWVILVALREDGRHGFYVLPRDVVVATVMALNLAFEHPSRVMLREDEFIDYADDWGLLRRPACEAPWRLRKWVYDYHEEMAWPDGHAGIPADCALRP